MDNFFNSSELLKVFDRNSQSEQNRQGSFLVYRWNVKRERESRDVFTDVSSIITATIWKYNNVVNAPSRFTSKEPVQTVKWFYRKHKKYVESKWPNIVNVTNKSMKILITWIKILLLTQTIYVVNRKVVVAFVQLCFDYNSQ